MTRNTIMVQTAKNLHAANKPFIFPPKIAENSAPRNHLCGKTSVLIPIISRSFGRTVAPAVCRPGAPFEPPTSPAGILERIESILGYLPPRSCQLTTSVGPRP